MQQVPYKQRGTTLLEVLVSMLLMAIIGLGAAYVAGRTSVMHRDQNLYLHTVSQLRSKLENNGCNSTDSEINIADNTVLIACTPKTQGYTVAAFDGSGAGVKSSAANAIQVQLSEIQIADEDTFVPIKVQIAP